MPLAIGNCHKGPEHVQPQYQIAPSAAVLQDYVLIVEETFQPDLTSSSAATNGLVVRLLWTSCAQDAISSDRRIISHNFEPCTLIIRFIAQRSCADQTHDSRLAICRVPAWNCTKWIQRVGISLPLVQGEFLLSRAEQQRQKC